MAGYRTSVRPYFHKPQASENTAQECNIQPYCLLTQQIIGASATSPTLVVKMENCLYIYICEARQ